ncbi:MAG: NAD-dependent epimerase/dehydratase family protein [Niallia sp.]
MKNINDRILITGVTGTLGGKIAKKFLSEGLSPIGLIRDEKQKESIQVLGLNPVLGDLTNRDSLYKAIKDVDIVIHCAAYLGDDLEESIKSNVIGVENLASISLELGIKKFIHISTLSVYGEPKEGFYDETYAIVKNHDEVYPSTKVQSERILNNYNEKGLNVIILRPGAICSEENSYWGDRQISRMISTDRVNWVHPNDTVPWIHADNLAELIYLIYLKGVPGEVYNAVDGNFPEKDFRIKLIKALGKEMDIPNREAENAMYSNEKIRAIGYKSIRTFEETTYNLLNLAISKM